jgi:hypothetical protein
MTIYENWEFREFHVQSKSHIYIYILIQGKFYPHTVARWGIGSPLDLVEGTIFSTK